MLALAGLLGMTGCASSSLNAQWSDPQFAGRSLNGATVLVACQANDTTLRRVCADRGAAKLAALGALPVQAADSGASGADPSAEPRALLQTARAAGAVAVLRTTLAPAATAVTPGPSINFGIGGFGGGYGSGGGIGIGMSAPVGGASVATGYAASASLTEVASGRLMWSASASAPPTSDLNEQLGTLLALLLDSARSAGLLPAH